MMKSKEERKEEAYAEFRKTTDPAYAEYERKCVEIDTEPEETYCKKCKKGDV